ncbi:NAD(P)-dependent alcohol dehydrogenase [Micromonospora tarapacensis]|uniref:NAD(P)-dependent alcohol dehydrogenase n=1 Tax=Micromonospora tarapacensis TaxID=2835305 RepID=UPI001E3EFDB3|nr:NAD(P)-dependent alcohol dehydrogenase [Micromonospora tarapacensis]
MFVRAVVYTKFGPPEVLRLVERPTPEPKPNEVLIRVHATTVTSAESGMRQGRPLWGRVIIGLTGPRRAMRTLGIELSGEIAAIGEKVTRFRLGDKVFGFAGFQPGANADYMCLRQTASLAIKPANTTFAQAAAAVDGSSTALFFLRDKANIKPGQRVLVIGASGSIGTYAVQLAKHFGAHVTGVCSTRNLDLVRELGADDVVDYTTEDFTKRGERYDIVFDTVGKSSYRRCRRVLRDDGVYLPTTGLVTNNLLTAWTAMRRGPKVKAGMSVEKSEALVLLRDLIEADSLRIVVDKTYPLERVTDAHRYVDQGRKRGNVVVTLIDD